MSAYTIEVQNPDTKRWETSVSGNAKSRRSFLKKQQENVAILRKQRKQFRAIKIED